MRMAVPVVGTGRDDGRGRVDAGQERGSRAGIRSVVPHLQHVHRVQGSALEEEGLDRGLGITGQEGRELPVAEDSHH